MQGSCQPQDVLPEENKTFDPFKPNQISFFQNMSNGSSFPYEVMEETLEIQKMISFLFDNLSLDGFVLCF